MLFGCALGALTVINLLAQYYLRLPYVQIVKIPFAKYGVACCVRDKQVIYSLSFVDLDLTGDFPKFCLAAKMYSLF